MTKTLFQKQTQLAIDNFAIGGQAMPTEFICALAHVKAAAASANKQLGTLPSDIADAIYESAMQIANGNYLDQFPIDIYQTGSGTSTNMNANEVIATLASGRIDKPVHPNDHVNYGQSSNDVIPTAMHVATATFASQHLLAACESLEHAIDTCIKKYGHITKTARTHLMDAMPITIAQEFGAWRSQLSANRTRMEDTLQRLRQLAIGGTAVGTGINTDPSFGENVAAALSQQLETSFAQADDTVAAISAQDTMVEWSGQLTTLATTLTKISNDLRWMNSGPNAGLKEITLSKLQAGSSIMPGKVNPVIPEAVAMACAQVTGLNTANIVAGQSGNFQLNVMLPLLASNTITMMKLLANSCTSLREKVFSTLEVEEERVVSIANQNPILVTALNPIIGYEKGAEIAQKAYAQKRSVIEVAKEMTDLSLEELQDLLDPAKLT